ncbi:hypothetical protein BJ166DRAFT_541693 [Pestalotiopsis sp. NC0098]|nr:hypothetical protein BJ166DRAFT_541693 [Pestalotiopsis sp. NC0098]
MHYRASRARAAVYIIPIVIVFSVLQMLRSASVEHCRTELFIQPFKLEALLFLSILHEVWSCMLSCHITAALQVIPDKTE